MTRTDRTGPKTSFPASSFAKFLRAFETGDLPYTEVQSQLRRLLATGASPSELLDVLRRRELIEPLPEYAHVEVHQLLEEAIAGAAEQSAEIDAARSAELPGIANAHPLEEQVARHEADYQELSRAYERARDAGSAAAARASKLEAELESARTALESERKKSREIGEALAETIALEDAAGSRAVEALRELEQVRRSLAERDSRIAGLQSEQARLMSALEPSTATAERLEGDLQKSRAAATELADSLAAAQAELKSEQSKSREAQAALAENTAVRETALTRVEQAAREAERHQADLRTVRESLAARDQSLAETLRLLSERDAKLAALRQDQGKNVAALEERAKALEAELQASKRRADALEAELTANRDTAASAHEQHDLDETHLIAVETKLTAAQAQASSYLEALQSRAWRRDFDQRTLSQPGERDDSRDANSLEAERDHLRAEVANLQKQLELNEAVISELRTAPGIGIAQTPPVKRAALTRESEPAVKLKKLPPPLLPPSSGISSALRGGSWRPRTLRRAIGLTAAIVGLATLVIFLATRPKVSPTTVALIPKAGTVIRDCPMCPLLRVLPAGRFRQGSTTGESSPAAAAAKPVRWVSIPLPFAMSINAVTVDEFRSFIVATGRVAQGCDTYDGEWKMRPESSWENPGFEQSGSHPVTCASWNDAQAYATWLSAKTGYRYRLPSASEWEYAARAGGEAVQPWSADGSGACANANVADQSAGRRYPGWAVFSCDDGYDYTAPVGSFKANAFGLYDMLGNVFQWTEDCWHQDYTGAPVDGSARTDGDCSERELRGGSWFTTPAYVRADYRNHFSANYRTSSAGIRLVRDVVPDDAVPPQAARNEP